MAVFSALKLMAYAFGAYFVLKFMQEQSAPQITFKEFVDNYLLRNNVERLEVVNKHYVRVRTRATEVFAA